MKKIAALLRVPEGADVAAALEEGAVALLRSRDHGGFVHVLDELRAELQAGQELPDLASEADLLLFLAHEPYRVQGDVTASVRTSRLALAVAVACDERRAAAGILTHLGLLRFLSGDAGGAELALGRAEDLFRELDVRPGPTMAPLVHCYRGLVLASSGRRDDALAAFRRGRTLAERSGMPGYAAVVDARFAIVLGAHPDALAAAERSAGVPDDPACGWTRALAHRALASAWLARGELDRAREACRAAREQPLNPLEASQVALTYGYAEFLAGQHTTATELVHESLDAFERINARYPLVVALIFAADLLPTRGNELLARADDLSGDSVLFTEVWRHRPELRIRLGSPTTLEAGGHVVPLRGKPLALLDAVVAAGASGIHWEQLAAAVWPEEQDPAKLRSRVTTTTSAARKALGQEGWRLRRDGPVLRLAPRRLVVEGEP